MAGWTDYMPQGFWDNPDGIMPLNAYIAIYKALDERIKAITMRDDWQMVNYSPNVQHTYSLQSFGPYVRDIPTDYGTLVTKFSTTEATDATMVISCMPLTQSWITSYVFYLNLLMCYAINPTIQNTALDNLPVLGSNITLWGGTVDLINYQDDAAMLAYIGDTTRVPWQAALSGDWVKQQYKILNAMRFFNTGNGIWFFDNPTIGPTSYVTGGYGNNIDIASAYADMASNWSASGSNNTDYPAFTAQLQGYEDMGYSTVNCSKTWITDYQISRGPICDGLAGNAIGFYAYAKLNHDGLTNFEYPYGTATSNQWVPLVYNHNLIIPALNAGVTNLSIDGIGNGNIMSMPANWDGTSRGFGVTDYAYIIDTSGVLEFI